MDIEGSQTRQLSGVRDLALVDHPDARVRPERGSGLPGDSRTMRAASTDRVARAVRGPRPSGGPDPRRAIFDRCGAVDGCQSVSAIARSTSRRRPRSRPDASTDRGDQLNPSGESDSEVTGFIDAVLSQRWSPTLATALRYSRQQGDASGLGGTVIVDAVSLSNTWDFAERWQLALRGDWCGASRPSTSRRPTTR